MNTNMADFEELMAIFSVPRPNGSAAERETARRIKEWLENNHIPFRIQPFRHYPYFFECIGVWIIFSRTLLALAIIFQWGWWTLPVALIGLLGGLLDQAFHIPLVTWLGVRQGENILIQLEPKDGQPASRELIFSAHYDSKTELLDHQQRLFLLKSVPFGIILSLLLAVLGPAEAVLASYGSPLSGFVYWISVALCLPLLFLAWAMGLNLSLGRLAPQSSGAVDNGSACAVILGLAQHFQQLDESQGLEYPSRTRITLALFGGEEVDRQGSRFFAHQRRLEQNTIPTYAVNMEAMAQDGKYVYWEKDGSIFHLSPTDDRINRALAAAVQFVTGQLACPAGPMLSDGAALIKAGIPTAVLGTSDTHLQFGGFHKPSDNLSRVVMTRLPEAVRILIRFANQFDQQV